MITIGTVKFDFRADNEPFARQLNGGWDSFFTASFQQVVDEVLSAYDLPDRVIDIDTLPLDLGNIDEDRFYEQFPSRLREALTRYCDEHIGSQRLSDDSSGQGIRLVSAGRSALEMLSFFLLHGYFPFNTDEGYTDPDFLLAKVISEEAYRFKEFLNAYGHYDSLCRRLALQYSDEQLEEIVRVVQPSDSKFITLYVRVQIRAYDAMKRSDVTRNDYRNVVWTLVLAYLFAEGGGYYNRKQIVMHTIRGLAAHFNMPLVEMVRVLTESLQELEKRVEQLPELWSILKDIRADVKTALWVLDGDYHVHLMREVVAALRIGGKGEAKDMLTREHLVGILSDVITCRKLLQQLQTQEIHFLVSLLVPREKEYVISYAHMLDKHKEAGTFSGRAGSEFRLLKWEFIMAVLVAVPASAFSRRQFVLSVLQRLAAHYNLSVTELIRLLYGEEELARGFLPPELLAVLRELQQLFIPDPRQGLAEARSAEEWLLILQTPLLARKFIEIHTEQQIVALVERLMPAYSEFIVSYAALLDKGQAAGMMEGKAGSEFGALKWEFIFACFFSDNSIVFHQKVFVYSVLCQLAAHYNQEVTELLGYFLHSLPDVWASHSFGGLKIILQELYDENVLPLTDINKVRSKSDAELEHWILDLFGNGSLLFGKVKEEYLAKWLVYFLNERNGCFRSLWKSGKLNAPLLLQLANRTASLRRLWLHKIGDKRLEAIYRDWSAAYVLLRTRFAGLGFLQQLADYLSVWMVELTASRYAAWSETEIIRFLSVRIRRNIPSGFAALLDDMPWSGSKDKNVTEIINHINELKSKERIMDKIIINNAGLAIVAPYFPRLFKMLGYLSDDKSNLFKDDESKIHAIFLMQYLVYGEQREFSETDLFFNKILVNWTAAKPLPRTCDLKESELIIAGQLFASIKQTWTVLSHTSDAGVRLSFFQRNAVIAKEELSWAVQVEEKAYDVLLDRIPWTFKRLKFSWMVDYHVQINWRD